MKKFMKFCAITAAILIAAGLVLTAAACAVQGPASISEVVDSVTKGKIPAEIADTGDWGAEIGEAVGDAVLDGLGKLDSGIRYDIKDELEENMRFMPDIEVLTGDANQSFSAEEIGSLDIEAGACRLVIKDSPDGEFHVEAKGAGKFQSYIQGKTLYIKAVRKTGIQTGECRIECCVPEKFTFEEINAEIGAGVLEFEELIADRAEFEVDAGQIKGQKQIQVKELELKAGAGEISINGIRAEKLDAEAGMGAMILNGQVTRKADLECSMGSITMKLDGSEKDYNYELDSAVGNIQIGSYNTGGLSKEKKIDNKAACDISIECSMGNIILSFTE